MSAWHSCDEEKSLFDVVVARDSSERWSPQLPDTVSWLVADGRTYEVKADEMAFTTRNLFFETGRTDGTPTGINITAADRWVHSLGRGALVFDPGRLRTGCEQLAAWGHARQVVGGDRHGTTGVAVAALDTMSAPLAHADPPARPRVWEARFAAGSAVAAADAEQREALKEHDAAMDFRRDIVYGEMAERYFGRMLAHLPLTETELMDRSDDVTIRRVATADGFERHVELVFRRDGELAGIATARGHWLVDFDGVVALLPADGLRELARRHYHATHRTDADGREIVRVPLWQLPFASLSSRLPTGLDALPESGPLRLPRAA